MIRTFAPPLWSQFVAALRQIRATATKPQTASTTRKIGHVTLAGAGPGSADLITLRGLRLLQQADVVFYDRLADPALLDHVRPHAQKINVGKSPGNHILPQSEINRLMIRAASQGHRVIRLKSGDPGIFGRGAEEAAALDAAGIPWDIVPGVTAACAAAASARSFLTERRQTERVIFATGHRREGEVTDWTEAATPGTTLACYMAVAGATALQSGLIAAGWPAAALVEVISKAQTAQQSIATCRLDALGITCQSHPDLNPAILLIRWPATAQVTQAARATIAAR